jgi:hypothetical protein
MGHGPPAADVPAAHADAHVWGRQADQQNMFPWSAPTRQRDS